RKWLTSSSFLHRREPIGSMAATSRSTGWSNRMRRSIAGPSSASGATAVHRRRAADAGLTRGVAAYESLWPPWVHQGAREHEYGSDHAGLDSRPAGPLDLSTEVYLFGDMRSSGIWGPRSNGRNMCGKPPGAKHYFFARRMACT